MLLELMSKFISAKSIPRNDAPIVLLVGPSCVGKSTICDKISKINEFHLTCDVAQGFGMELWGQDFAKEQYDKDRMTGYSLPDIFGKAMDNSKKGIVTILDLGSSVPNILDQFENHLNQAKEVDTSFNPPLLRYAIYLPLDELFARLIKRNSEAERRGRLHIDGRYGAPTLMGYVGLVCNLNPEETDPKRFTGEVVEEEELFRKLKPLAIKEKLNLKIVLQNLRFVEGRAIIGIRDEKFDKFFNNDSLEKSEKIAREIFSEIKMLIEREKSGSMSFTEAVGASTLVTVLDQSKISR